MKANLKLILILLLVVALFTYNCAKKETPQQKEVKKFVKKAIEGYNSHDVDKVITYFHKKSPQYKNLRQDLEREFSFFNKYEAHDVRSKLYFKKIRIKGDTARVYLKGKTDYKLKVPFHEEGNLEIVLKKRDDKWKIYTVKNLPKDKKLKKVTSKEEELTKIEHLINEYYDATVDGDINSQKKFLYRVNNRIMKELRKNYENIKQFEDYEKKFEIYTLTFHKTDAVVMGKIYITGKRIESYSFTLPTTFVLKKQANKWKIWQIIE